MFGRSLVARLMLPLALMTALVIGTAWLEHSARYRIATAQDAVETQVTRMLMLTELRSTSRALQRDALNLGTEPDRAALAEIGDRFTRRFGEFNDELAVLAKADTRPDPAYYSTQREVLKQLAAVRDAAATDRPRALLLFRTQVRPAERRASAIADAMIRTDGARIDALHREVRALEGQSDRQVFWISALLCLIALAIALLVTFRTVLRPLDDIRIAMERLAAGDAGLAVPHANRPDAIGVMARSIEIFREAARERDTLLSSGAEQDRVAEKQRRQAEAADAQRAALDAQRKQLLGELAAMIDSSLTAVNGKLRASAERLSVSADEVARHAIDAGRKAGLTTGAAEKVTRDLGAVFADSGELAQVVDGLRGETQVAAEAIRIAATRSRAAAAQVATLSQKADQVAAMAELIRSVAQKATLLALNATIEAARVGEAGKGFAVVAAEMGNLARQTSAATEQVDGQVESIRSAAVDAGAALGAIDDAVAQIERHASLVASAVEQQGGVSAQIRKGMELALEHLATVGTHMVNLGETAESTGVVAGALEVEAKRLGADADMVDTALRRVIGELRSA
ncbi:MAG: methyl-accepting chemotaxis sensory transducer [Sphingomonas bacterium]|uniref:methyl-accepting chemotaxis protein n=1 Tax=Sphingomonas bacterium TaxID=1895847 RepID=UPI00261E9EBD|nr:methyl-accepting chemotaxis protein [Sphingomonas bacterium]MDB5703273.1 methyl-accepting chemotaxis sensory transducer [Sphingomonas bacterium]